MSEITIPQGLKAWPGGPKPADWDGKCVMFRDGHVMPAPPPDSIWKLGWGHHYGNGDIIAYSTTPTSETDQLGGVGV